MICTPKCAPRCSLHIASDVYPIISKYKLSPCDAPQKHTHLFAVIVVRARGYCYCCFLNEVDTTHHACHIHYIHLYSRSRRAEWVHQTFPLAPGQPASTVRVHTNGQNISTRGELRARAHTHVQQRAHAQLYMW